MKLGTIEHELVYIEIHSTITGTGTVHHKTYCFISHYNFLIDPPVVLYLVINVKEENVIPNLFLKTALNLGATTSTH